MPISRRFMGSHRRAPRPSRRDPGIDAVAGDLPAATRVALVAKLSQTLAQFVVARNWLSADRVGRIASEARDARPWNIAARSRGDDMRGLVRHLRTTGQLTAGLILAHYCRAISNCSIPRCRNCLTCRRPASPRCCMTRGASLQALLIRAGLPESTFAAFRMALEPVMKPDMSTPSQARLDCAPDGRTRADALRDDGQAAEPLLILLRRFATESARKKPACSATN